MTAEADDQRIAQAASPKAASPKAASQQGASPQAASPQAPSQQCAKPQAAGPHGARYAEVVVDIPARALGESFAYAVPERLAGSEEFGALQVGCTVLVRFASRPALGYVVSLTDSPPCGIDPSRIKPIDQLLGGSCFPEASARLAHWVAREYVAPLSEALRLVTPPGAAPKLRRGEDGAWCLAQPNTRPLQDRWTELTAEGCEYTPPATAVKQQAIVAALRTAPMRVSELGLSIKGASAALKAMEKKGVVRIWERRRNRAERPPLPASSDIKELTAGQSEALKVIMLAVAQCEAAVEDGARDAHASCGGLAEAALAPRPPVIVIDGVTGSGKTEVYLQAIRAVLEGGGGAIVLVPEISLTPQTVARFRSRFGEQVAVLHSRLAAGERLDQWDLVLSGQVSVVVGARSALFAPVRNLRLIIVDEEHEATYKQGSTPRYVTRDVAVKRASLCSAAVVLGSATPSMEALERSACGEWLRIELPERASGKPLPPVHVVDLKAEFAAGNNSMLSRTLQTALLETLERREKAVLLLNRRGFASFLLCRDCGFVPTCEDCSVSLTYHKQPPLLKCHHCGREYPVPTTCPQCGSIYIRQLGPGTQFAYDQVAALAGPDTPIVRMDADTTRGKDAHERLLEEFAAASHGILLGTQMIAKGLDFPDVTLVGVLIADTTLKFPDFRASERTFQLLEQVAGRAGRKHKDGRVIVQTYWPGHVAIRAAAAHDRSALMAEERASRSELSYPPFARLANILVWGPQLELVSAEAYALRDAFAQAAAEAAEAAEAAAAGTAGEAGEAGRAGEAGEAGMVHAADTAGEAAAAAAAGTVLTSGAAGTALGGGGGGGRAGAAGEAGMVLAAGEAGKALGGGGGIQVIGPAPCLISRRKGEHRWHVVIKTPLGYDLPAYVAKVLRTRKPAQGARVGVDIDPYDMM